MMIAGAGLVVIGFLGLVFATDKQGQTNPVANEGSVPDADSEPMEARGPSPLDS